ncbi:hypothetical protein [Gephyromycinifex aptenodytis]|uniref:hypothetical protein n=1 Tax=Gephyromycinifex aptenodytis TaxID=2716227 RepID=UPI0014473D5D|nr:hypothetical protein [Gephyromycinifex aptenodytis]
MSQPIPCAHPGVRITVYAGQRALPLAPDLAAVRDASSQATGESHEAPWLSTCLADEGALVVTLSLESQLCGYAAGTLREGTLRIAEITLADAALAARADLLAILVDALLEAADTPWLRVVAPDNEEALAHLLATGWLPWPRGSEVILTAA